MSSFNPNEQRFGDWLTTNVSRSWDETMVVVRSEGAKADYVRRKKEEAMQRRVIEAQQKVSRELKMNEENLFSIKINNSFTEDKGGGLEKDWEAKKLNVKEAMDPDTNRLVISNKRSGKSKSKEMKNGDSGEKEGHCSSRRGMEDKEGLKLDVLNNIDVEDSVDRTDISLKAHLENPLAMVLYCGKEMNEVISGINSLGLKRNAAEDWDSVKSKRRKLNAVESSPKFDISVYVDNLRKVKARIRRSVKKKGRGEKENIPTEKENHDEEMEDTEVITPVGSDFIFKAGSSKRKKMVADGTGGWPLTATKTS